MVKRGLSVEEKRQKLLDIYHSTNTVYNLKEIEKAGSKAGVVQNTVKEVNDELVNDGLVEQDKIGSSNFYWSFPSKAIVTLRNQVESLRFKVDRAKEQLAATEQRIAGLEAERVDGEERRAKLRRLDDARATKVSLDAEADALKDNDPAELERVFAMTAAAKEGVNRWTANTWAVRDFLVKKRGIDGKTADRYLQIGPDFDEVE
ncbi:unnamed protein product [Phaeothamnion confervicola]